MIFILKKLKKTFHITSLFLVLVINTYSQTIKISPELKIDSTEMKITESNFSYHSYTSYDNKKVDSLIITIASVGTSVTALIIDLINEPYPYISLYSDYKEFNGKHIKKIEFEKYKLELNSIKFKKNDSIYGRFKGISKPIKNNTETSQIEFSGKFSHITGKLMLKKKAKDKYLIIEEDY